MRFWRQARRDRQDQGHAQVGYGVKEFERASSSKSNIYAEAQLDHKFTENDSVILTAVRGRDESDVSSANSIVETTAIDAAARFTTKLTGNLNVKFTDEM